MSNDIDNPTDSKPSKAIKQSGFGLKKKLRSGYTKRFGSIISSKNNNNSSQEDLSDEFPATPENNEDNMDTETKKDKLSSLSSSSQSNMNNSNNTSLYILRRNNSRTNSRSNSIVNSLYLNNLNTGLHNNTDNAGTISTPVNAINTMSGFTTPKMGPMTPTYPYNSHRYQNSISSFSSIDLDNNQVVNNNNIDLTNEFINIFKQEYENHCMNPKITPFDQSNPPPGVVEIVYQKSITVCKKNKVYVCKINKNSLNLDNNHKLFNILKHILKESASFNNRRNVSRANSVTSFQLDTSYQRSNSSMLNYVSSTFGNVSNKGLISLKNDKDEEQEEVIKDSTPEDETFLLDDKENIVQAQDKVHHTPIKNSISDPDLTASTKKKNAFTNPILFSPRKLKRDSKHLDFDNESIDEDIDILVGNIHKPQFLKASLLENSNINTNFKYSSEKDNSDISSLASTDDTEGNEKSNRIELKQAPCITKKHM